MLLPSVVTTYSELVGAVEETMRSPSPFALKARAPFNRELTIQESPSFETD